MSWEILGKLFIYIISSACLYANRSVHVVEALGVNTPPCEMPVMRVVPGGNSSTPITGTLTRMYGDLRRCFVVETSYLVYVVQWSHRSV